MMIQTSEGNYSMVFYCPLSGGKQIVAVIMETMDIFIVDKGKGSLLAQPIPQEIQLEVA